MGHTGQARGTGGSRRGRAIGRGAAAALAALSVLGVVGAGGFFDPAGASTTITVNTVVDENLTNPSGTTCVSPDGCSLRAAPETANNVGRSVTIDLPTGTYLLTLDEVLLVGATSPGSDITIVGADTAADTIIKQEQPEGCTGSGTTDCQGVFSVDSNAIGGVLFALSNV